VVKGERKGHRWAGSSSGSTFYVDSDLPRLHQVRYTKPLNIRAFGYIHNEDHRLIGTLWEKPAFLAKRNRVTSWLASAMAVLEGVAIRSPLRTLRGRIHRLRIRPFESLESLVRRPPHVNARTGILSDSYFLSCYPLPFPRSTGDLCLFKT
jgi:hypothetical protein